MPREGLHSPVAVLERLVFRALPGPPDGCVSVDPASVVRRLVVPVAELPRLHASPCVGVRSLWGGLLEGVCPWQAEGWRVWMGSVAGLAA